MTVDRSRILPVGVTTSPRPERYLLQTLRSLFAAASSAVPRVVVAPQFVDPDEDWDEVRRIIGPEGRILDPLVPTTCREFVEADPGLATFRLGNDIYASEAAHRGLQKNTDRLYAALLETGAHAFLALQDDLVFCRRALDRVQHIAAIPMLRGGRKNMGAVSFYTPYDACGKSPGALWMYSGSDFYGELAVLWRATTAREFLAFSQHGNAHDLEIGRFFGATRWRLYGHSPCLCQHTGVSSARGAETKGMRRETMNFNPEHNAVTQAKEMR